MKHYVSVQSLIDHIKTAMDVDPWAKEMAETLLGKNIPKEKEIEGGNKIWWYVCPACHGMLKQSERICHHCGQKLIDGTNQ